MLYKGSKKVDLEHRARVIIECDHEFQVYGLTKEGKAALFGPPDSTKRRVKFDFPGGEFIGVAISTNKDALWTMDIWENRGDPVDPVPVEAPLGYGAAEPLESIIRRYIRSEYSLHAQQQGEESFDEANDFDIDDEEPEWQSPYEMQEMQEENFLDDQAAAQAPGEEQPTTGTLTPKSEEPAPEASSDPQNPTS